MKFLFKFIFVISLLFHGSLSFADMDAEKVKEANKNNIATFLAPWVVTGSIGPAWERAGKTQSIYISKDVERTFAANRSTNVLADLDIFVGFQQHISKIVFYQLGLMLGTTSTAQLSGEIWEDGDPTFNNYTYNYAVKNTRISIKGKLLADLGYIVTPWISGSAGLGYNVARNFITERTIFEALPTYNFTNNTVQTFTYTAGIGFQRDLSKHLQVGLSYEYAEWGKSQLERTVAQSMNTGVTLNHLQTNGFKFNVTYIS